MPEAITVHCPACETAFPVDPGKVPPGGVRARCSVCREIFPVEGSDREAGAAPEADAPAPETEFDGSAETGGFSGAFEAEEPGPGATGLAVEEAPEETDDGPDTLATPGEEVQAPSEAPDPATDAVETPSEETAEIDTEVELETSNGAMGGGLERESGSAAVEEPPTEASEEGPVATPEPALDPGPEIETEAGPRPTFGQRSPEEKAERLARVLVSDMISYNEALYREALEQGTLEVDFEDEIEKSWEEYVEQVGEELAESTSYWADALNDILAEGEDVF